MKKILIAVLFFVPFIIGAQEGGAVFLGWDSGNGDVYGFGFAGDQISFKGSIGGFLLSRTGADAVGSVPEYFDADTSTFAARLHLGYLPIYGWYFGAGVNGISINWENELVDGSMSQYAIELSAGYLFLETSNLSLDIEAGFRIPGSIDPSLTYKPDGTDIVEWAEQNDVEILPDDASLIDPFFFSITVGWALM